ncbi:sugar kinase [Alkalibacillus haloalkaliphilus]|uniref:2-dehydro-3-deoxygluconokinase n=1 Tax=Alkalibacillus haloalkaliphilus TaxID=94136 RepID=A0A511W4H0_9BACI|nr:sugar kinase [Alkalibacillus haloalkaliphilus]GEN45989.1 2-dehydro-3-deoxygluconokinase [Alkalibacillus haloalkaliphilus]
MSDVITIGDAMITFDPATTGPLRFNDTFKRKVGGAEFNVAIGLARLGVSPTWISRLGKDEFGRYIYNFARGEGIDVSEVELVNGYSTSLNFKEIFNNGSSNTYYYRHESPTQELTADRLNEELFKNAKVLHVTGVFPAMSDQNIKTVERAINLAKLNGVKISMDPNIRLKLWSEEKARQTLTRWMKDVDFLLTGLDEAELLFGTSSVEEVIEVAERYEISHLFIKDGSEGSKLWTNGNLYEQPALKGINAVDTVGAGDGFDAAALYGLVNNWSAEETLKLANTVGAMVVEVYGDNEGLPYLEDAINRMNNVKTIER